MLPQNADFLKDHFRQGLGGEWTGESFHKTEETTENMEKGTPQQAAVEEAL